MLVPHFNFIICINRSIYIFTYYFLLITNYYILNLIPNTDDQILNYTPEKALKPPSTGNTMPVTKRAVSDANQIQAPIKSSGSPNLPIGV